MQPSLQNVDSSVVSSRRRSTQLQWDKLEESFYSGNYIRRICSPISSPPDILWSSSGSSDVDVISRSHSLRRVVTKLDFDSCVAQSPDVRRQFRARVTRNVIKVEGIENSVYNSEVKVLEQNKDNCSLVMSSVKSVDSQSEHSEVKVVNFALETCNVTKFSKNLVDDSNVSNDCDIFQNASNQVSETAAVNNSAVTSPVIGSRKLITGDRKWQKKKKRKVCELLQEISPIIFCRNSEKDCLNKELEEKHNLTKLSMLTTDDVNMKRIFEANETSPVAMSEENKMSQSVMVSPVMKLRGLHRRWHKWKRSINKSYLGQKSLNVVNMSTKCKLASSDGGNKERNMEENVELQNQTKLSTSPVLGKKKELYRQRKRKVKRTDEAKDSIQTKELENCLEASPFKDSVLNDIKTQQNHVGLEFLDNEKSLVPKEHRTEMDSKLKEGQNCKSEVNTVINTECNHVINNDVNCTNPTGSEGRTHMLSVTNTSNIGDSNTNFIKQCIKTDIKNSDNFLLLELGKTLKEPENCVRQSDKMERKNSAKLFPNIPAIETLSVKESLCLISREQKCGNTGKKDSSDGRLSTELLIETETSQEINVGSADVLHCSVLPQENCTGEILKITSPISSSTSHELELEISSCSTPKSQKIRTLNHHNEENESEESMKSYLDSAKKKRLKLNKSGMAARLKKLLARQHSSTRIWQHETSNLNPLCSSNRGMLLFVHSVWTEYSHVLAYCSLASGTFVSPQSSEGDDSGNSNTANLEIVVVFGSLQHFHVKPQSTIRIYPPWQSLNVSRLNITLLLDVTCVEEVETTEKQHQNMLSLVKTQPVTKTLYVCPCSCLEENIGRNKCQFQFRRNGLEFLEYLLPQEIPTEDLHCKTGGGDEVSIKEDSLWQVGGIGIVSEVVANQGCLLPEDICLQLCVLQVFRYRSRGCNKTNQNDSPLNNIISWSILGCDVTGECCEVMFDSDSTNPETLQTLSDIMSRKAIGQFYKFTGFTVRRRIHRTKNPGLWSLIIKKINGTENQNLNGMEQINTESPLLLLPLSETKNEKITNSLHSFQSPVILSDKEFNNNEEKSKCNTKEMAVIDPELKNMIQNKASKLQTSIHIGKNQLFVYILSPGIESWTMEKLEEAPHGQNIPVPTIELSSLAHTLKKNKDGPNRHTYLAKLLCVTEDYLYVSDSSVSCIASPGYMIISVKPSCFIPSQITSTKTVLLLQDIQLEEGNLSADKYSWIIPVSTRDPKVEQNMWLPNMTDEDLKLTFNVKIVLPRLTETSAAKDLVTVAGIVAFIDEETAFAWPVCGMCENDLLVELAPNKYLCQNCNISSQTLTNMSLEVFISSPQLPASYTIKVKLQQDSIIKLLPTIQDNSEGYELSSVLGSEVGPLCCIIVRAGKNSFLLNEIPSCL